MSNNSAFELSKWMSSMANIYEQSIITVIDEFNKALCESSDIDNAKLKTIGVLGQLKRGEV